MKYPILIAIIALSCQSFGQIVVEMPYDSSEEKVMFRDVIEVPDKTKDQIFVIARTWAVKAFIDADKAITYEDKEAGIVSGRSSIAVFTKSMVGTDVQSTVYLLFKVEIKDKKLRYTFFDFSHKGFPEYPMDYGPFEGFYFKQKGLSKKNLTKILSQTKETIEAAIKMLNDDLSNQKNDDW